MNVVPRNIATALVLAIACAALIGCDQSSPSNPTTTTAPAAELQASASIAGDMLVLRNDGAAPWSKVHLLLESVPRARWQEVADGRPNKFKGYLETIPAGKTLRIGLTAFRADGIAFASGYAVPTALEISAEGVATKRIVFSTGQTGRFRAVRSAADRPGLSEEQREKIRQLEAIGYAAGSTPAEESTGVLQYDAEGCHDGLNLYVSGHAPGATLMDMEGNVLHTWNRDFWEIWPDYPIARETVTAQFWRRAFLLDNGAVLGIFEGLGLVKLDKDSNVIWAQPNKAHHDLWILEDGRIVVLTREAKIIPRIHETEPVLTDFISVLSPDGEELQRVRLLEALEKSAYPVKWADEGPAWSRDLLHTNTIHVLGEGLEALHPAFKPGNVLTSFLSIDAIAVVDLEAEKVVWMHQGAYARQHDPRIVDGDRLLLFDNQGRGEWSTILEYQLPDMKVAWKYEGSPEQPFYSQTCGTAARLPNGNTLITESDNGRAIEVTREGEIVWEFLNPSRAGDQQQFIATLFDVVRLPTDAYPFAEAAEADAD